MFTFYICFSVCPDLGPKVVELLHFRNWFCFHFPAEFEILFQWVFPVFSGIPRAGCLPSGNAFSLCFLSLFPIACWDEAQLCGPRQCQGSTDPVPGIPGQILHLWFLLYSAELPWCWDGEGATAWPFPLALLWAEQAAALAQHRWWHLILYIFILGRGRKWCGMRKNSIQLQLLLAFK